MTSQNTTGDIIDSLLQEFPCIRAGFLVSADATVPRNGNVRVGDVVVGLGSGMKAGVVFFDDEETTKKKRLFMTGQSRRLPEAVLAAINELRSHNGRKDWLRRLQQDGPTRIPCPTECGNEDLYDIRSSAPKAIDKTQDTIGNPALNYQFQREFPEFPSQRQPKAFGGMIASSEKRLKDPALIDSIAAGDGILCFDTAAANIKSRPFLVVSGIASCCGDEQELPSHEGCKIVASYVTCLVHLIDPTKLAAEVKIASYFEYETFDLDRPGFRLLRLEAGDGPIKCHVFQAYLDEDSLIEYEALSYCWGNNRLTDTVIANEQVLFITENLSEALQHLRYKNEDRILWIDAICIDQSNIRERGHQVGCMGRIYSRANRVLIWLGYVKYELSHLISALNQFEKSVPRVAWSNWEYDDPRWQTYLPGGHNSDGISQQSRLKLLMSQPWFDRVWILQEVAKAKRARIGCTQGWINAGTFALAPRLLGVVPDAQCQAIIDIMPGPSRRSSWWSQKQNICTLLWRFRGRQASDPRDRLYALLNLASDGKIREKITADYTKNEEAVVREVLTYLFNDDQSDNGFIVRDIAHLQRKIPNLSCIALERMILSGTRIEGIKEFLQRQNTTVWLSEAAATYTRCVSPALMDYLMNEAALEHVAIGPVLDITNSPRTVTVKSFMERRKKVKITRDIIEASHENSIDLVASVVEQNRDDLEITEPLIIEAVRKGSDWLGLLLDRRGDDIEISEAIIVAAAGKGVNTLRLLLDRRGKEVKITEGIIKTAHESGINLVELVVERGRDDIEITEAIIMAAAQKGSSTLQLLLDRRGGDIKITEAIIVAATRKGSDTLELLLDRRGDDIEITEAIVMAAARNGSSTLRLLLDRRGSEVRITEAIVNDAVWSGVDTLRLLLDRRGKEVKITKEIIDTANRSGVNLVELVVERGRDDIKITEAIVVAAAQNGCDKLELLIDRRGEEVKITEGIIETAHESGINLIELVVERGRDDIEITEAIVVAAVREGVDRLQLLLDRRGDDIKITEAIIVAAARKGSGTLQLLLDRRGGDIKISEAIIVAAAWNGSDTLELLLDRRGDDIKITEAIIVAAARNGSNTLERFS
ncbi:hypothetical protein MRS44_008417 [Fusarium solani]|nr:hypothetical protein MRS44_008417 [Fusarium solani]